MLLGHHVQDVQDHLFKQGLKEIVYYSDIEIPERWIEDFNISSAMFAEAGVEVRQV